ncbi:MAG: 5-methylthioadenosine phosphorylase [Archaeoglobi archaeon]|nr:S-methyl-5'-thioadenosine phosphorylase [Candidatus Mnemosynella bozhongmuii]MDI3501996.1 5-methylthioadenosine phosphorylase [Archaeoglobi archaeon]MDK2781596.1 5-methylthioadenosine phosphorylase [Archaeoglobi archaeon]
MEDQKAEIGIIGGTGVYDPEAMENIREVEIETPFGKPSDRLILGEISGRTVAFLPRHGRGHLYSPTKVNYRANIYAMKKLGVSAIISVAAVGSLKEEIKPLDIVLPDQIYDRTKHRVETFFEDIVVHIGIADPFCRNLIEQIAKIGGEEFRIRKGGTYVCIEGPQFSTRAESMVYRSLGFDIIGMTAVPEAKLAREAEICYATIATVTDYDVWYDEEVSAEMVIENAKKNEENVKRLLRKVIPELELSDCECRHALRNAITTSKDKIGDEVRKKLGIFIEKYI